MKSPFKILIALSCFSMLASTYAGTDAGKDSSRHYKSYPEKYDGQSVSIDCTHVKRINGGPQVEGVAFFVAHSVDEENKMRGGSIVVAVLEENADALAKKFGTIPEIDRQKKPSSTTQERVDSKHLRGTFHQLEKGHVYIDVDGDTHELILLKKENAKGNIRMGDGIPTGDGHSHGPNKKKKKKAY